MRVQFCEQEDLVLGDAVNPAAADAPTEAPAAAPGGSIEDWDEDDELLALQQEAWVRTTYSHISQPHLPTGVIPVD